ncbi:nuclear transport factor 2 family protein [Spirillospora sp. NPDC049024]|uniref:nuclear transport factor 2 family protein n=1 Tax=unclassified Actinomadura TaxID=2626254 RepID=UPI0011EC3931|nr:nuclear transport factor 2 family protein [Actinomadura sp. K4S16]
MTVPGTFRSAVEAKDLAAIIGALDPAIEFRSPVMVKPYVGRDTVAALLGVLLDVFEDFHYTDELVGVPSGGANGAGPPAHALVFSAKVLGKAVQGLDLLRYGETGLVTGLTVMVRPLPAAMTLARVVGRRMEDPMNADDAGGPSGDTAQP